MSKRALVSIGTVCSGALIALGLLWFLNSSVPDVYAKSPAASTVNTALFRPVLVPPTCEVINSDINANTTWDKGCYHIVTDTVKVKGGMTLGITPPTTGTWVYFDPGTRLQVEGALQAMGVPDHQLSGVGPGG